MTGDPSSYPMLLEPRYIEKPWGGRRMEGIFGRALPAGLSIGESWELFDRPAGSSRIRNGPLLGHCLAEYRAKREIPILLKILDIRERLSVQVHPDAGTAHAHGTEAKTEAWVVLEAGPEARIWRGFCEETTPDAFREAVAAGTVADLLHSFAPKAGEVVTIPAGTVHAAAGGLLLAEIQQSSECTYRLFDWARGGADRPLQIDRGLEALRLGPAGPDRVVPRELGDDGNLRRLLLVANRWFEAEHLTAAGTVTFETADGDRDRWHAVLVLSGSGVVRAFDRRAEPAEFRPGDTSMLPASRDAYEIEPRGGQVVQALAFREA